MQPQAQAANDFVNENSVLLRECEALRDENSKVLRECATLREAHAALTENVSKIKKEKEALERGLEQAHADNMAMKDALDMRARTDRIKASETLADVSPSVKPAQIREGSIVRVHGLVSRCIENSF
jgi:chromosome segregation ATPase